MLGPKLGLCCWSWLGIKKLPAFFKRHDSTTVEESLNYGLNKFEKSGWIKVTELK